MQNRNNWWHHSNRVIQTNLQIKDTALIDPERLALQIEDLGANVLVFNVGGIYAWYPSSVKYHHINEYLSADWDLLEEVIHACHSRNIRFVGRFDFSKAEDSVYQEHPEWFMHDKGNKPQILGAQRPGNWSLLYSACINSPYWNEAVAIPVLTEAVSRYDMDGVFFNATFPTKCRCNTCRNKYKYLFGTSMPDQLTDLDPSWESCQLKDNITLLNDAIKRVKPDIPLILYYWKKQTAYLDESLAELVCDESQDILSQGVHHLPDRWKPAVRMKLCSLASQGLPPYGIIHSSPGMDWRHTSLPPTEYMYWMSQIPASGGYIWHSLTGIPDTIPDKRILNSIRDINRRIKLTEPAMTDARPCAQIALLWDDSGKKEGWLNALFDYQMLFSLLTGDKITMANLHSHTAVIIPEKFAITADILHNIMEYVHLGGNVLFEGRLPDEFTGLFELCGIEPVQKTGEYLVSSYLRFEDEGRSLQKNGMEETPLIAFRGSVAYSKPASAKVLATLVPPFAPLEAVGAPPERASILTPKTEIPLCLENHFGSGKVLSLTFSLSDLITEFGLGEHVLLAANLIERAIGKKRLDISNYPGLMVSMFEKDSVSIIHMVNGTGHRPLTTCLPLHDLNVRMPLKEGKKVHSVRSLIKSENVDFTQSSDLLSFTIDRLEVWEAVQIQFETI